MTRDLALKLKEAGFPKTQSEKDFEFFIKGINNKRNYCSMCGDGMGNWLCPMCKMRVYVHAPTLKELIEACGDRFEGIWRRVNKDLTLKEWVANGFIDGSINDLPSGNTPEEAVANLYLELNSEKAKSEI